MAMRLRLRNGGEISTSLTEMRDGGVIIVTELRPDLTAVLLSADEAKTLAEALLAAVNR